MSLHCVSLHFWLMNQIISPASQLNLYIQFFFICGLSTAYQILIILFTWEAVSSDSTFLQAVWSWANLSRLISSSLEWRRVLWSRKSVFSRKRGNGEGGGDWKWARNNRTSDGDDSRLWFRWCRRSSDCWKRYGFCWLDGEQFCWDENYEENFLGHCEQWICCAQVRCNVYRESRNCVLIGITAALLPSASWTQQVRLWWFYSEIYTDHKIGNRHFCSELCCICFHVLSSYSNSRRYFWSLVEWSSSLLDFIARSWSLFSYW